MFKTVVARTAEELSKLQSRWEQCRASQGTIFQTYRWTHLAALVFAAVEAPLVIMAESDAGLAIIPAVLAGAGLSLAGDAMFDYRGILQAGDAAAVRSAWSELAGQGRDFGFTALQGGEQAEGWEGFGLEPFANAPGVLREKVSAEEFRAAHSRLGRQVRRLAKQGVSLRRYDGSHSLLIRWIYEQKAAQPQGSIFTDARRREFMERIAAADPAACDVFTFETETAVVAALVTFRHNSTRHFYTIYFDPAWAHYSPGQVLVFEATALSLAEGYDCDYMTGEYPYKTRLATHSVPLFRVKATADRLAEIGAGSSEQKLTSLAA